MNQTKTRLLLAGWWCATVIPGLTVAILFTDDAISGTGFVFGVWIIGFVVQLFLFMAVSRQLRGVTSTMVLWIVVSVLPFGVDWAVGINWWAEAAFVLVAVAVWGFVDLTLTRSALLQQEGIPATAVVLEVKKPLMNVVVNNVYIKRKLRIRVERDDRAPSYEATYSDLFMLGSVPDPGDSFRVVVDPRRPERVAAADTPRSARPPAAGPVRGSGRSTWRFTSWHGPASTSAAAADRAAARAARRAPSRPASPAPAYQPYQPTTPARQPARRDLSASLSELAQLHERGQLTDAEFAIAKQELLGVEDSAPPE